MTQITEYLNSIIQTTMDLIIPPRPEEFLLRTLAVHEFPLSVSTTASTHGPITTLSSYDCDLVKFAIQELKFHGNKSCARFFSEKLYTEIQRQLPDDLNTLLIIPMPLHPERERERGYNQVAVVIDRAVAGDSLLQTHVTAHALIRKKKTLPQVTLDRAGRIANVHNAFSAHQSVDGKYIVLIDDVYTTGATFASASDTLLQAGAKKVCCIALARA